MSEAKIKDLRINKGLTKQQLIDSTVITENELSFVTDDTVVDVPAPTEAGKVLTSIEGGVEWAEGGSGGGLPDQTGNEGKFLTTDGTDASWSDKPLVNETSIAGSIAIGRNSRGYYGNAIAIGSDANGGGMGTVAIGSGAGSSENYSVMIGRGASGKGVSIGSNAKSTGSGSIAIGTSGFGTLSYCSATATCAIQLGTRHVNGVHAINEDPDTFKVANRNGNFELMSADGTIPADRLAKNETLTADAITLVPEHIYTGGELATVSVTLPTALSTNEAIQLNFGSGATATNITINKDASQTLVMKGAGCSGGVFSPAANKNYSIMFYNNGFAIIGLVIEQ